MYLTLSIAFLCGALYALPNNFGDIPFGQMTFKILYGAIIAIGCFIFSFKFIAKSLKKDRIWPWRWTLPYFGNLCIRLACICMIVYTAHEFIMIKVPEIFVLLGSAFFILMSLFSPDLNIFEEKELDLTNEEN